MLDPRISRQVSQSLAQNVIEIHKTNTAAGGGGVVAANVGHMSNNNSNTDTSNQQQSHDVKCATKQQQNDSNKKDCKVETQEQRLVYSNKCSNTEFVINFDNLEFL